MLIDAIPFFNETLLLEFRLSYLYPIVDKFIIVESSKTQSGLDKEFVFEKNKHKFKKYIDKIIYIQINEFPEVMNQWSLENFQRNCIARGFEGLPNDACLMISDLDEIPNRYTIQSNLLNWSISLQSVSLNMSYHAYYVNLFCPTKAWRGTVFSNLYTAKTNSCQELRNQKDHMVKVDRGGWHLSWLGGYETFEKKLRSCCEPFHKKDLNFDELKKLYPNCARDKGYFLHADDIYNTSVPLSLCDINLLPEELQKKKYESFILK